MDALLALITPETLLAVAGCVVVGLIIGALSMMLGIGGGTIMVPTFRLIGKLSAVASSATSLFVVVPTGVAGVLRHLRAGTCRDRKSTRLNSSHPTTSRMPSSA